MYERGALDADHDDLNPFYYQHYYFYRRGYNDARRQSRGGPGALVRRWALVLLFGLAVAGIGWFLAGALGLGRSRAGDLPTPALPQLGLATTPSAAPSAAPPTPTPAPSPSPPPQLQVGGRAKIVNVGDAPLRARAKPGLAQTIRVVARFPLNSEVALVEGPTVADGLTWWRIKGDVGEGWSAERSAEGLVFLEPLP
jgi:hypothetical protein